MEKYAGKKVFTFVRKRDEMENHVTVTKSLNELGDTSKSTVDSSSVHVFDYDFFSKIQIERVELLRK